MTNSKSQKARQARKKKNQAKGKVKVKKPETKKPKVELSEAELEHKALQRQAYLNKLRERRGALSKIRSAGVDRRQIDAAQAAGASLSEQAMIASMGDLLRKSDQKTRQASTIGMTKTMSPDQFENWQRSVRRSMPSSEAQGVIAKAREARQMEEDLKVYRPEVSQDKVLREKGNKVLGSGLLKKVSVEVPETEKLDVMSELKRSDGDEPVPKKKRRRRVKKVPKLKGRGTFTLAGRDEVPLAQKTVYTPLERQVNLKHYVAGTLLKLNGDVILSGMDDDVVRPEEVTVRQHDLMPEALRKDLLSLKGVPVALTTLSEELPKYGLMRKTREDKSLDFVFLTDQTGDGESKALEQFIRLTWT